MPEPQENSASVSTPAGGIDLSGLRTRTVQQAKSELPQPTITPPWEEEPRLESAPNSKLTKAYQDGKQLLEKYGQHFSEKVLTPFREGLDRIGDQLQQAGESGHTQSGGRLTDPTRALLSGAGTLLKQVPVGRDIKSTALAWATPPELGPEGKALSRELKAGEKAEQWRPHDLGKAHDLPSEQGYAYHATNEERAKEIAESGGMRTHKPWEHTDQNAWPDGSTEKRIYFTPKASSAWQFAPEEGKSVLLRVKQDAAKLKAEGTGDLYSQNPIHHKNVEILGDDKQWHRVSDLTNPEAKIKSANEPDLTGLRTRVVSPAKAKPAPKPVEPVGIHEDDVPRGSKTPDVDWSEQDLQDSAKTVNEQTIAKDYGPKRKGAKFSVYKSHIPMEDLPSAKVVEEEDPEFQGSDWRENYQGLVRSTTPPMKVRVSPKGEMEILDGNHRAQLWSEADMTHAPAWVIDERGKGIENLSEGEKTERAELEEERQAELSAVEQKKRERQANLKGLGIGLTEMEPADAKNWVGYTDQKSLKIYRGVDDPSHAIEAGDYVTTSKESARNYGKHVQELEVSPAELRYVRGHKDGDPLKLDQGGQTELIYAPKVGKKAARPQSEQTSETLYHGSPDVSKIDSLKPGSAGGYFGNGVYLTRDPDVARRFTKLESANPTLERNADGSFTDINTGKRVPGGQPGVLKTSLKNARLKDFTIDEMDAEIEKFRKPNGVIDLDAARNAVAEKYAKQGYDGFDVKASKYFDEPQVVIFPSSAEKLSIVKQNSVDLSGLRVRPVGAGRQPANWTAFVASDGRKYRFPSDVTWEQIVKADPGAKRIK